MTKCQQQQRQKQGECMKKRAHALYVSLCLSEQLPLLLLFRAKLTTVKRQAGSVSHYVDRMSQSTIAA